MTARSLFRRAGGAAIVVAALCGTGQIARAQPDPRASLAAARRLVEGGSYRDAVSAYTVLLSQIPSGDTLLRASAAFGRAFASQQLLASGDTAGVPLDSLISDYGTAFRFNRQALGVAALNNAGLVMRLVGNHRSALSRFQRAAALATTNRDAYLWAAGKEYEALGNVDSARVFYRLALAVAPASIDARRALLNLLARNYPAESVLVLAEAWRGDSASAGPVSDALLTLLVRSEPATAPTQARKALVALAATWPELGVGPAYFEASLRDPLAQAVTVHPEIRDGVRALADAYRRILPDSQWIEPATSAWWQSDRSPNGSFAVWSSVLRSLGDGYYHQRSVSIAKSYYEAAIGWGRGRRSLNEPWIDYAAFLPLALIYGRQQEKGSSERLEREVTDFTEMMFVGKMQAYQRGDLNQIRSFHMTLGALYAAKGEWTGTGPRNAEFQLEHMRMATEAIAKENGRKLVDPPDLLEKLGSHYQATGRTEKVASVKAQITKQYRDLGRPDSAEAVNRRIDRAASVRGRISIPSDTSPDPKVRAAVDTARMPAPDTAIKNGITTPIGPLKGAAVAPDTVKARAAVQKGVVQKGVVQKAIVPSPATKAAVRKPTAAAKDTTRPDTVKKPR